MMQVPPCVKAHLQFRGILDSLNERTLAHGYGDLPRPDHGANTPPAVRGRRVASRVDSNTSFEAAECGLWMESVAIAQGLGDGIHHTADVEKISAEQEQWARSKSEGRQQPTEQTTTQEIQVCLAPLVPARNQEDLREDQQVQEGAYRHQRRVRRATFCVTSVRQGPISGDGRFAPKGQLKTPTGDLRFFSKPLRFAK